MASSVTMLESRFSFYYFIHTAFYLLSKTHITLALPLMHMPSREYAHTRGNLIVMQASLRIFLVTREILQQIESAENLTCFCEKQI